MKYPFIKKSQSNLEMKDYNIRNPLNIHNHRRNNGKYSSLTTKCSLYRTLNGRGLIIALRTDMRYKLHYNLIYH